MLTGIKKESAVRSVVWAVALVMAPMLWASDDIDAFGEKVVLRIGAMWSDHDTSLRLDGNAGVGVGVDLEDFFDLDEQDNNVLQFSIAGRFKQRHHMGFQYYRFNRQGGSVLNQDWQGENVIVEAGAVTESELDIRIYDLSYAYSFIRDAKHEFAGTIGLFWMNLGVDIALAGEIKGEDGVQQAEASVDAGLNAPLPVFGLNYIYAANSRWLTQVNFQYFTLRTNLISGSMVKVSADTRYYLWDHLEVGGGLTIFDLGVTLDSGDLKGRVDWSFWGPQLFLGLRF